MSRKNDRRLPGDRAPFVAVIALVLIAAGAGGYWWFRASGMPKPSPVQQEEAGPVAPAVKPIEQYTATLYVPAEGNLAAAVASVRREFDPQLLAREAAAAVFASDRGGKSAVLKDLKLRALYLDAAGTAYLDLAPVVPGQKDIRASVQEELLAVYSLVNTVAQNVPEVHQVRILLDGREAQTLAGHIDLSRSFVKRTDLVRTQ